MVTHSVARCRASWSSARAKTTAAAARQEVSRQLVQAQVAPAEAVAWQQVAQQVHEAARGPLSLAALVSSARLLAPDPPWPVPLLRWRPLQLLLLPVSGRPAQAR